MNHFKIYNIMIWTPAIGSLLALIFERLNVLKIEKPVKDELLFWWSAYYFVNSLYHCVCIRLLFNVNEVIQWINTINP